MYGTRIYAIRLFNGTAAVLCSIYYTTIIGWAKNQPKAEPIHSETEQFISLAAHRKCSGYLFARRIRDIYWKWITMLLFI